MQTNAIPIWRVRMVTFAVAALAALSGTYWVLKSMQGHSVSVSAAVAGGSVAAVDPQTVARALGGSNAPVTQADGSVASSRSPYVLVGVVADPAHSGAALISVDGKPAKPYRVGAVVDGSLVLQSVAGRKAVLADGPQGVAQLTLELPPLSK